MSDAAASLRSSWRDSASLSVLGMGHSLPGEALDTNELLARIQINFNIDVQRRGAAIARRLKIGARHLCRDLRERCESPRPEHTNAALAAEALKQALAAAPSATDGGDADRGAQLIGQYGCGYCHTIPGIANAKGRVGPPLSAFGDRLYVAGMLPNTRDNLMAWIENPQRIVPGNVMPVLGISEGDARDIAAYLHSLH